MTPDPFVLKTAALCIVALCIGGVAVHVSGKQEFRDRLRVWLVAAPVVLVGAVVPFGFAVLASGIAAVAGVELARMSGARVRTRVAVVTAAVAPVVTAVAADVLVPGALLLTVLWAAALLLVLPAGVWMLPAVRGGSAAAAVVALGLVGLPLVVLATADPHWVLATVVAVSLGDVAGFTGGHAVRRLVGRPGRVARLLTRPLSRWSPNKTVAGGLASVAAGGAVLVGLGLWWLAPLVPLWGVIGDLRESRVKRVAGGQGRRRLAAGVRRPAGPGRLLARRDGGARRRAGPGRSRPRRHRRARRDHGMTQVGKIVLEPPHPDFARSGVMVTPDLAKSPGWGPTMLHITSGAPTVDRPSTGGALARHLGWRAVLHLTGGFAVRGELPAGGCVVVANHSSHADTPALLAALDPGHTPVVAAAADHWFRSPGRAALCRTAAAGFPVRRDGGGSGDLAAAGTVLDAGGTVVVFPSGSRTAATGTCHSGAFRLAAAHGVPVVPVGVNGTATLAPPTGPRHRARVSVRIGAPVAVTDVATALVTADAAIEDLATGVPAPTDSRLRVAVARLAARPRAAVVLGVAAFAEAVSWPLLPELTLAALVLAGVVTGRPSAARWYAGPRATAVLRLVLAAGIGSVLGGLLTAVAARHGVFFPQPLTTSGMGAAVRAGYLAHGPAGVWSQPLSGVPFKVFAREAGTSGVDLGSWAGHAVLARTARLAAVATIAALAARRIARRPRVYPWLLALGAAAFVPGLWLVLSSWT